MHHSVPKRSSCDNSLLGLVDAEIVIIARLIRLTRQFGLQVHHLFFEARKK